LETGLSLTEAETCTQQKEMEICCTEVGLPARVNYIFIAKALSQERQQGTSEEDLVGLCQSGYLVTGQFRLVPRGCSGYGSVEIENRAQKWLAWVCLEMLLKQAKMPTMARHNMQLAA